MIEPLEVPAWIEQFVIEWVNRLHLGDWTIKVRMALPVDHDGFTRGLTDQYPEANTAIITLRPDVEDNEQGRMDIIHELLHVAHARIDHYVEDALLGTFESRALHDMGRAGYRHHYESYTARMAEVLYRLGE